MTISQILMTLCIGSFYYIVCNTHGGPLTHSNDAASWKWRKKSKLILKDNDDCSLMSLAMALKALRECKYYDYLNYGNASWILFILEEIEFICVEF